MSRRPSGPRWTRRKLPVRRPKPSASGRRRGWRRTGHANSTNMRSISASSSVSRSACGTGGRPGGVDQHVQRVSAAPPHVLAQGQQRRGFRDVGRRRHVPEPGSRSASEAAAPAERAVWVTMTRASFGENTQAVAAPMPPEPRRQAQVGLRERAPLPGPLLETHDETIVERVPGPLHVGRGRSLVTVVSAIDEMTRHAEDSVALQVFVVVDEDLCDQRLEARLEDEEMQMRRPEGMA